ncbi:MAG: SufE family protein [Candidatus Algichlamydia australiensis]|nr:SufE family protein [Chlamydiales bacterium]
MFEEIKKTFASCKSPQEKYEKIIALGRNLPKLDEKLMCKENLVHGCQSQMFLTTKFRDGKVFFEVWSDALISAGLGSLLKSAYSGLEPEIVIKEQPKFLEELGLLSLLSPTRSNGLKSLYLKMQQEALRLLTT